MPAAELSRLRTQINGLILRFDDPTGLRALLRDLLELYADHAYRPGQALQPQPLLPSYRVAPLIMHTLEMELSKTCQEMPEQALKVVELLWQDPYLEPRLLAAALLGAIPVRLSEDLLRILRNCSQPTDNFRLLDALFRSGTAGLRRSAPDLLIGLYEEWTSSSQTDWQAMGVHALIPLIEDPQVENLPPIFRLLSPLVQNAPAPLHIDLQAVIEALANRTPTETAYFLRQTLSMASGAGTARLIRRCLPSFGPSQQATLRTALKTASVG